MNVGLVAQKGNSRAAFLAATLRTRLRETGVDVTVDAATAETIDVAGTPLDAFDACDLIVSIGGDGTFLFAARGANGTPILGVNLGEVGFLNAVGPDEAVAAVLDAVADFRAGELDAREAPRLAASGDGWTSEPATNEVVIQGPYRGHGGGVGVEIRVDGSLYSGSHADGVLVATPTGSTAYNLSEKGPLITPDVDGLVVTEMCATGGMPPLVVGEGSEVSVTLTDADSAVVVSDGRLVRELSPPTEVRVSTADSPLRIAGPSSDFFEALGKLD
ncbi:NAD(+)/NADH kinase [Salinirarus marinus]|uniref:NAD(+)/NADH kinase n=1 Tax=Salinirarus marinus TaxID=3068310 RepID=UPI003C6CC244